MPIADDSRILLLGGAGFMGRALAARLQSRGLEVHVVTRAATVAMPRGIHVHGGGIENVELLRRLLPGVGTVVHLASATTPGLSGKAPSLEANLNIGPTLGFLEELQRHADIRLVYVSSGGTVYGNPTLDPVPETAAVAPLSFYGAGKVAIENFLLCFQRVTGSPVAIARPSNLYGPGQPFYQGFGVIRTMLQHVRDGSTMKIWGDGTVVRDFVYIDDVVSALECLMDDARASGIYNVGSGVGHSLVDLIGIIDSECGKKLQVEFTPSRNIDVHRIVLDCARIRERLGWTANMDLNAGIGKTWEWLCRQ